MIQEVNVINVRITTMENGATKTIRVTKTNTPATVTPSALAHKKAEETATGTNAVVYTYAHGTGTGTGTAHGSQPTHHVKVGRDGKIAYEPPFVMASAGDIVRFTFFPRNHSVTSCSRDDPCVKDGVFDSGFKATFIQNSTAFLDFPVSDDKKPMFFYRYDLSFQLFELKD